MIFNIDFDCHWGGDYPVDHTFGSFPLNVNSSLDTIFYIKNKFLNNRNLCGYHFIISSEEYGVFEIKMGA